MTQNEAKRKIQELVSKYEQVKLSDRIDKYSEQDTKDSFIRPMFEALGWDFDNREEVSKEEFVNSAGRVDYGIYLHNQPKLFIEAKKLGADIHKPEFAEQAIRYCFNRVVTWAVLTDFESLKVFNAQNVSENLSNKLYFEIPYSEYVERFDQIWQLSKESFETGLIDKEAIKVGKLQQKITVTEQLAKDLNEIREMLTNSLHQWNEKVSAEDLDEGVQKLLDRLIFIRVAEDRGIEEPILKQLIREFPNRKDKNQHLYQTMISKFRELDNIYNSGLFSPHPFENWQEYSDSTEKAIDILYGKSGYYEYDFKFIPSDVLGQVYENYLGHLLSKSRKGLTLDVSAKKRKEQGIYYTPSYIEDYIVEQALKPVLDKCHSVAELKAVKVLDPACGSGSFLIKAMEMIEKKYVEFGARKGEGIRLQVLLDNIYGVDLDEKAVEIARLNLVINSLETRMKLPGLEQHIKNGNSLISGTDEELKKYFGKNFRDKKPFNWEEEFPGVFNRPNPGFDVIIGNPPYINAIELTKVAGLDTKIYWKDKYNFANGTYDIYILFFELGIKILRKNGLLAYITPNKFLSSPYGESMRTIISREYSLKSIINLSRVKVFESPSVYPIITIIQNKKEGNQYNISIKMPTVNNNSSYKEAIVSSNLLTTMPGNIWGILLSDNISILKKVLGKSTPLLEIAKVQATSTAAEADEFTSYINSNHVGLPIINTGTIDRYATTYGKTTFTNKGRGLLQPYLDITKINEKRRNLYKSSKIIIAKLAKRIEAFLDEGEYSSINTNCVHSPGENYSLELLIGVLNSKLISFIYAEIFSGLIMSGGYFQVQAPQLRILPICRPNKDQNAKIIAYTKEIAKLYKQLNKVEENSNKWHEWNKEIEKTDKNIDQLVYKIYELTESEISVVEQSYRPS